MAVWMPRGGHAVGINDANPQPTREVRRIVKVAGRPDQEVIEFIDAPESNIAGELQIPHIVQGLGGRTAPALAGAGFRATNQPVTQEVVTTVKVPGRPDQVITEFID